ncbi:MAG: DNA import protein CedA [Metallosphaera sp.]|uniref:DNA import protein CedA n=1 Tax=Metallosphaera sp. TaxID=2020860 RepID=UPI0031665F77
MDVFELLGISEDLAGLTYFIGTLIMALPVPIQGLKKWGPKLITDGIYSSILVNLYETFLSLLVQIGNVLGTNWNNFFNWVYQLLANELTVYTVIRSYYAALTSVPYSSINPIVGPISMLLSIVSGFMSVTGTLIVISELIYNYVGLIIVIGILLMSMPFRIGRSFGGSMIGFGMVFYIGLPLLPSFLSDFNANILQSISVQSNYSFSVLVTQVIPIYIEGTVLMPLAYLGMLASLSLGVGYAISGMSSRLPIPLDFL